MDDMARTGRVIAVAGSLETLLELHGARGTGLREKTESLRGQLPSEALELSRRVGMVRNRVAHEPEAMLTDGELLQYEENARRLACLIEGVASPEALAASAGSSAGLVEPGMPVLPPKCENPVPEDAAGADVPAGGPPPPDSRRSNSARFPKVPRLLFPLIPGVHLLFLTAKLLQALKPGWWYWVLLGTLPAGAGIGFYYHANAATLPRYWLWIAIGWVDAGYLLALVTAWAERAEHPAVWKWSLLPGMHGVYLVIRIFQCTRYGLLLASGTALAAQGAAVWLAAAQKEWPAAAILTCCSILGAFLLRRDCQKS